MIPGLYFKVLDAGFWSSAWAGFFAKVAKNVKKGFRLKAALQTLTREKRV